MNQCVLVICVNKKVKKKNIRKNPTKVGFFFGKKLQNSSKSSIIKEVSNKIEIGKGEKIWNIYIY